MPTIKKSMIEQIIREPYVHFLVLGFLLYLFYQTFHTPLALPTKQSIAITATEIQEINHTISKQWGRSLQPSELELMIDATYFDEILLHEALSLELERKDRTIRTKLISQMRQILAPIPIEPNEEQLHAYYQKHRDDYTLPKQISFAHIYLHNLADIDIKSFVEMLNLKAIVPQDARKYGEKFTQGNQISSSTRSQVTQLFGKYFAGQLWRLKGQKWQGAIRSQYGYHIVFITHKQSKELQPFDAVEDRVYSDYIQEQRDQTLQSAYKKLATQYILEKKQ